MPISYDSFADEFEKIALSPGNQFAAMMGTAAVAPFIATYLALPKSSKERIKREIRDPRLYSNLRGMLSLEDSKERVKAHKGLKKSDGTVLGAMKSGLFREKTSMDKESVDPHSLSAMADPHSLSYLQAHGGDIVGGIKRAIKLYRKATPAGPEVTANYIKGRAREIAGSARDAFGRLVR